MINFGIDTTVRMRLDGKITSFPVIPLSQADKDYLLIHEVDLFVENFKKKLMKFKLLEGHEKSETANNKSFYASAFIFMKRCTEMFDKSRYEEPTFSIMGDFSDPNLTKIELNFAKNNLEIASSVIEEMNDSEIVELRKLIAVKRLEHIWQVYALRQIVYLMKETVKTQVDKGIPKKSSVKVSATDSAEYLQSLRDIKNSSWDEEIAIDDKDITTEMNSPISEFITIGDKLFKKYIYCINHLEMSGRELTDEFGSDSLKELKTYEQQIRGKK